ncbi:MAG: LL-diaminopimelate aminotransferase [Desulfonauticus sp.]|jgi:LL-diaminopimelate aminotransferase|nr:MAG: LL-diaminopimelate aminotransferase [Desulfonauticus sp. 38_4375]MDK2920872.1 LL-diaminopimelate aminotransferase [Desulfonauticus sp.]
MIKVNSHYLKLKSSYLFADIARRVRDFQEKNPNVSIIRLGIGDVTLPLPPACIKALHQAVDEMASASTFRGYGPEQGYDFLREKIAQHDYQARGVDISPEEIFISDGAKCDTGNFQELFAQDIKIAVPDPVYPVYVDTNVMAGRTGEFKDERYEGLVYLASTKENNYLPELPSQKVDLIYLCFPNNPTGATIGKEELTRWVNYALENKALILFDAAYEAFIQDENLPHSIFEIPQAKKVAVEFRSFSKTAGFTGTRCAFTVVPKECVIYTEQGNPIELHKLWLRRQTTKFNGVAYPIQRAAEAVYSPEGQQEIKNNINYYLKNAQLIRTTISDLGLHCVGGENSPYIWIECKRDSWEFFDLLLQKAGVVCTPGVGFGKCGQGYVRLSAFNSYENVQEAMQRIKNIF